MLSEPDTILVAIVVDILGGGVAVGKDGSDFDDKDFFAGFHFRSPS